MRHEAGLLPGPQEHRDREEILGLLVQALPEDRQTLLALIQ